MSLLDIFSYSFMMRAFAAGVMISLLCGLLGVFLVLRRLSLIGDGLSHVTFGSVALAMYAGFGSNWLTAAALPPVLAAALWIQKLIRSTRIHGDAAIGIVSAGGIAAGVLLSSIAGGSSVDIVSFLFGSILTISNEELLLATLLCLSSISGIILFYHELFAATFDEELAVTSGVNVRRVNIFLLMLTAVTVVLAMKLVGIMLISALLILPASTALNMGKSFKKTLVLSAAVAVGTVLFGITASFMFDLPSGAVIVISNIILFSASLAIDPIARAARTRE